MKGIKDKSDDLKVKGTEVLELWSVIKKLQVENYNLEQKLSKEMEIEEND